MKIVYLLVTIILSFWFFRAVPIGTTTAMYSVEVPELAISRPRYLIPREIHVEGWPLPGGDFHLVKDPGIGYSMPAEFSFSDGSGSILAMAFTVNIHFEDRSLHENVILVVDSANGTKIEYNLQGLELSGFYQEDAIFVASVSEKSIILLLTPVIGQIEETLVKIPRGEIGQPIYASVSDRAKWDELVRELRHLTAEGYQEHFCKTRYKPVSKFWTETLRRHC